MGFAIRATSSRAEAGRRLYFAAVAFGFLATNPATAVLGESERPDASRVAEVKVTLRLPGDAPGSAARALCSVRMVEGSSELAILCRHELGAYGEVSLARSGTGARSEPPFWNAPLASPFEAVAPLSEDALSTLFAGELTLRIDTGAA